MLHVIVTYSTGVFEQTVAKLTTAIEQRGLTLFADIDHAAGAQAAGLELEPERVLVFGNPRSGTGLMQSDRRVGIELPLRLLVWQEGEQVLLGYEDPSTLAERYALDGQAQTLAQMATLPAALVHEAATPPGARGD